MKLNRNILEQLVEETLSEMAIKIVKFSPQEMMQLHQTGQIDKDGIYYQYEEPVEEGKINEREMSKTLYNTRPVNYDTFDASKYTTQKKKGLAGLFGKKEKIRTGKKLYGTDVVMSIPADQVGGPKGEKRYYSGTGKSRDMSFSRAKADMDARNKMAFNPSDSLTVKDYGHLLNRESKQDISQQMADIQKQKHISKKDKEKLEKLAKMMAKANESYSYKDMIGIKEAIHHSQMRIIYVPKKDIKKALKVIKSMPFSLKGKVEVEKKPSDKVRNHFRIITTKQLFNAVVEYLATADIGVKTISKGKM
jgi:hypothetical protein